VEPVPETVEAFKEMSRFGDTELAEIVLSMGRRVTQLVPECIGLSVSLVEHGVTFTLMATDEEVASWDALQYLDGGPCLEAVADNEILEVQQADLLDEGRWLMHAQASAAAGVKSSLSLPVGVEGQIIGGINLYASTPDAFTGKHEQIAAELGAQAEGAITNADLEFRTRRAAMEAPDKLADQREVDVALGIIVASHEVDLTEARNRLEQAAQRAGISLVQAARAVRFVRGV
jgi:GAF domain-containing protein